MHAVASCLTIDISKGFTNPLGVDRQTDDGHTWMDKRKDTFNTDEYAHATQLLKLSHIHI